MNPKQKAMEHIEKEFNSFTLNICKKSDLMVGFNRCKKAINIALEEQAKQMISDLEDMNNVDGLYLNQAIDKLKKKWCEK